MANTAIGEDGAPALGRRMKENSLLTVLDLPNNAIGNVGAATLAKGLEENSSLGLLSFS